MIRNECSFDEHVEDTGEFFGDAGRETGGGECNLGALAAQQEHPIGVQNSVQRDEGGTHECPLEHVP